MQSLPDSDHALDHAVAVADGPPPTLRQSLTLPRRWRAPPDELSLEVDYTFRRDRHGIRIEARLGAHRLLLDEPVRLGAVDVGKPWGREIWFTGIEARGESTVETGAGALPLSQYLALAPQRLTGRRPLVLLKVLDPRPEPVLGDLYFEVHEQKREVYVVTHVDRGAWPDGRGAIRFGMNPALRRRYADDDAFRRDYLDAVRRYEAVRRALDAGDASRAHEEPALRAAMDAFSDVRSLEVGDVVVVPTWLPHALQHGVRVVEFQTPTYERYILSFAQKVLTQAHWDTEVGVARMRLDVPEPPRFEPVAPGAERIVAFDDFRVWRIVLPGDGRFTLPDHPSYGLCMVVQGEVGLGGLRLGAEQAAFVPRAALAGPRRAELATLVNDSREPAVVLLAAPDL